MHTTNRENCDGSAVRIDEPFRGGDAITRGLVNRHRLRTHYRTVFPGVYLANSVEATLRHRTVAAWLWSRERAVITGQAAAALHGSKYVDENAPVELIWHNTNTPSGVVTCRDSVGHGETTVLNGMTVSTLARTAFDLGRRGPLDPTVARMDSLLNLSGLSPHEVMQVAARHPGARGLRQLEQVLLLSDAKAESPRETWLRLLLGRATHLPPVRTQVKVYDDRRRFAARVDFAWHDLKIAVEYDGEHHRVDSEEYAKDVQRLERLHALGWIVIRVLKGDSPKNVLVRVEAAFARRSVLLRGEITA